MEKDGTMKKIEFDVSWDERNETFADVMAEAVEKFGVEYAVIDESGPGGGWPVVWFTVSDEKLESFIDWMGYGDDMEFWLEGAWEA